MITIDHLQFGYTRKKRVLHDVCLSLGPGFTLLVGENGSGKSTLMKIITGVLPDHHKVLVDGRPIGQAYRKRAFAFLPQEMSVYSDLNVRDVLQFISRAKGLERKTEGADIERVAEWTNIERYLDVKLSKCSLGTRRRIGIATTLLGDPEVIVLDEPTAGVDPRERANFYETIRTLFAGKTVIVSTHILEDVDILADRVVMLSGGRITFDGAFAAFAHSLDGRLLETSVSPGTPPQQIVPPTWRMVRSRSTPLGTAVRAAIPPGEMAPPGWMPVEPTWEDIWQYHLEAGDGQVDL